MKRAGGKPKGHKDTGFARVVAGKVDPHRARAELEFLRALNALLPVKAFDELSQIAPEMVADWTIQWHINCPCVLEAAWSLASLAQIWRDDAGGEIPKNLRSLLRNFGESYRGEPIPKVWLKELALLNKLPPVAPAAWPAIATERELRKQEVTLKEQERQALANLDEPLAAAISATRADALHARALALERSEVLAPIATDAFESRQEFLARSLEHWDGRRARLLAVLRMRAVVRKARMRVHSVRPTPEMASHAQWLVRVQVYDESYAEIANRSSVTPRAVETAVRRLSRLLRLKLRRGRGRPRRSNPRKSVIG